jgi:hypothetical protein
MPKCEVEITRPDGEKHTMALDADSTYDAACKAMQSGWARSYGRTIRKLRSQVPRSTFWSCRLHPQRVFVH